MFLLPGIGGWLSTGWGVWTGVAIYISMFLPIFGQ